MNANELFDYKDGLLFWKLKRKLIMLKHKTKQTSRLVVSENGYWYII